MNTKFLRDETNKQLDIVRALPEDVFTWDTYMGLHESITNIQVLIISPTGLNSSVDRAFDLKTHGCGFDPRAGQPNNY